MSRAVAHADLTDAVVPQTSVATHGGVAERERALELLPIPAATVQLAGDRLVYEVANRAFARAVQGDPGALDALVTGFLTSGATTAQHDWRSGGPVERRHWRVCFSRLPHRREAVCLVTFVDQTAEVRTEETLRREMSTDSLTGLPNRSGFADAVEMMIENGAARWAVLMLDLTRFSRFNACLGSMAGDELLITVARRIKGALRAGDVLARTGGDEFGILIRVDAEASEAERVARRIRAALSTPFRLSDYEIRIACAIGIAFGESGVAQPEDVIRHAQVAMKSSKASGEAEAYQTTELDSARAEFALETALRRAIDNDQLSMMYQPICDLATGRVHGFEALARWVDEAGQAIEPSRFIPVAEDSGLIVPLGRWAVESAVRTLKAWDLAAGGDSGVTMAVNVSPIQLQRDDVPGMVGAVLARHGLSGERLKIEVTESAIIADPERIATLLMALKELGATIAMDDFGTGYSNLASLQKLPIDVLKIDRSFVTGMLADRDKIAIVRAILSLAQALSMATVAEGIEGNEVGQTLAALGCTYGQGYAFARPLDADAAYALLAERNA